MATSKIFCTCCGKDKALKEFYMSKSYVYKATKKVPICKSCIEELYNKYLIKYDNNTKFAIYYMCRAIGTCFSLSSYSGALSQFEKDDNTTPLWQIYMTKLNSLGGKNGAGDDFDSSDELNFAEEKENNFINKSFDKEIVNRWGKGFDEEALEFLEEDYHEWTTHNDCSKLSVQRLVQMICIKEWEIRKARQSNDPTDKLEKALLTLMDNSSLTPKTMSAINETDSTKIYGLWIKDIEKYRPAEYFEDKELYKDHDGILDYFNRFVLRPLKNLLTGSRDFDKEFSIEDEEVEDETLDNEEV